MEEILRKPTVTVNGYKCVSASVSCILNRPIAVTATVCSGDTDGSILTTKDIMDLGKTMQSKIFEDPSVGDLQLRMYDGESSEISYSKLVVTSCDIVASTSGGLIASISATSPDILVDLVDPSLYMKFIDLNQEMYNIASDYKGSKSQDHFWVWQLKNTGGNNASVAKRVLDLVSNAKNQYQISSVGLSKGTLAALESQKGINDSFFRYARQFLTKSDDTTAILNGNANINDTVSRAIDNTIASCIFDRGGGIFSKLLNQLSSEFLLWYIPNHKTGDMGIFKSWDYEGSDQTELSLPVTTAKLSVGRALGNDLPPTIVVAESPVIVEQNKITNGYTTWISASYPEKAEEKLGRVYNLEAPGWFSVGYTVGVDSNTTTDPEAARNPSQTIETANKAIKQAEKNIKSSNETLSYLARQEFFKYKYSTSVAGLVCPFMSNIDADIGDFVQVSARGGGKLFKGILSTVSHNLSAGNLSTELGFTRVEI